ncbi:MAG TPA: phage major capsid protein [Casimicrobiaceae bacterium]|nr:phage major capsid protein [Casimicrobiaceae bacterium]
MLTERTTVRTVIAAAIERMGNMRAAEFIAKKSWIDRSEILDRLNKSTVPATDASDATTPVFAGEDFADALRPSTVIDRLTPLGARRVPAWVKLIGTGQGAVGYWIGNRKPIPVSRTVLTGDVLKPKLVGAISVVLNETLEDAGPETEALLSRDLVAAAVQASDYALLDPTNAGDDYTPASITSGVTALPSTGSTLSAIDTDLQGALDSLIAAGSTLQSAVWLLHPRTAVFLSKLRGSGGAPAYPEIGAKGGVLLGLPVLTTANLLFDTSGTSIVLLDADDLVYCDGGTAVTLGNQATIDMRDDPGFQDTNGADVGMTSPVSMMHVNATAIRSARRINWALRNGLVAVVSGVSF